MSHLIPFLTESDRGDELPGCLRGGCVEHASGRRVCVADGVGVEAPEEEGQHGRRARPQAVARHNKLKIGNHDDKSRIQGLIFELEWSLGCVI